MRKTILMVAIFVVGILVGLGATSVFAQGPTAPPNSNTWQGMQQSCQQAYASGDTAAMAKLHEQCTGGQGGATGGMMGGGQWGQNGMMGGGRGGMMGTW